LTGLLVFLYSAWQDSELKDDSVAAQSIMLKVQDSSTRELWLLYHL